MLSGKVAIVTGASRGIGRETALTLAGYGATVIVNYCGSKDKAEAVVEEITAAGGTAKAYQGDVSDFDVAKEMITSVKKEFGSIDILVNNAGINRDAMLHKLTEADWDTVIDINLKGTFLCMQQAAIRMRERGAGRIINIASASWLGNVGQTNYSASKAGVVGMTKTACRELAKKGVTVNAICPGFIDTDMTRGVPENVWQIMISKIPAGYAGEAKDVGECVAFLASDGARYINGEVINVGGGMVL